MQIVFGVFLIAHGLVHGLYFVPRPEGDPHWPFSFDESWFGRSAGAPGRSIGAAFVVAAIVLFALAGLSYVLGVEGVAAALAVAAAAVSLLVFLLYLHPWLALGFLIDFAILGAVLLAGWPD